MATGIAFPESNLTLGAPTPEDAAAGTVYGLPVLRYRDLDGQTHCLSKWQLGPEELEEVARTGVVWFNCWGPTHPPIWISGSNPFDQKSASKPETAAPDTRDLLDRFGRAAVRLDTELRRIGDHRISDRLVAIAHELSISYAEGEKKSRFEKLDKNRPAPADRRG